MRTTLGTLEWPVRIDGARAGGITQEFRPPAHEGVDIAIPGHLQDADGVTVVALAPGVVREAKLGPRGHEVLIDHGEWASGYLHLAELEVAPGDRVEAGHPLGTMGADPLDGEHVVHLHLQIAISGRVVDPAQYLGAHAG